MIYIKIFSSAYTNPAPLPTAIYRVNYYNKTMKGIGGPREAAITVYADHATLNGLSAYLNYGIHLINDEGTVCWYGSIESITININGRSAEIICKGWRDIFRKHFYAENAGMYAYMDGGGEKHNWSEGSGITAVAQSVYNGGLGWDVYSIDVNLYCTGTRSDTVSLTIVNDSSGSPNLASIITSWTTSPTDTTINATQGYLQYDLGAAFGYNATTKWIVLETTGSPNLSNYYQVGINSTQGYSGGQFKYQLGGTWFAGHASTGRATDIQFKLLGKENVLTQISNVALESWDELTGIDLLNTSAQTVCQYRDGYERADEVIQSLLQTGDASQIKFLARITPAKRIAVYTQPTATTENTFRLRGATRIGHSLDQLVNKIRVGYTTQSGANVAGTSAITAWYENTISQERYGTREASVTLSNIDASAAANAAQTILNERSFPQTTVEWATGSGVNILGPFGGRVRKDTCPVGYWARIESGALTSTESSFLKRSNLIWVDEAEYRPETDEYTPTPQNDINPLDKFDYREI